MSLTFQKPIVMIDIDNTLYDFTSAIGFKSEAIQEYADIVRLCGADWDDRHHRVIAEQFMVKYGLYDGAVRAVNKIRASGIEVVVYTKRPNDVIDGTARALRAQGMKWDMFLGGDQVQKVPVCRELGVGVIVDDAPFTIVEGANSGFDVLSMFHHYVAPLEQQGLVTTFDAWKVGAELVVDKLVGISA